MNRVRSGGPRLAERRAASAWVRARALRAAVVSTALLVALMGSSGSPSAAKDVGRTGARRVYSDVDFEWSWRLAAGKTIEIKGVNGDIDASPSSGAEVEVTAKKHARRSDPREVKIEVIEHQGGVTICAVYPGRWGERNDCTPGERGHSHVHDNDVVVDFRVRVPAGIRFVGRTVNGEIYAAKLKGPVEGYTVNGSVSVSTEDIARATTVNGSLSVKVGASSWNDELEFSTVNGGITVTFPNQLSAAVDAETVNGDITTDFPLEVRGKRFGARHLTGRVGNGSGGDLSLSTVNGSIRLLAAE